MNTLLDIGCNDLAGFRLLSTIESIPDHYNKIFVEANPECWDDLEESIKYIPNSTLVRKAVSNSIGEIQLATRPDEMKCTGATIMGDQFLKDSLGRWNIHVDHFKYHTVPTTTIQQIIKDYNIDPSNCILKLDAEGIEYDLLNTLIENNITFNKIYCEFHVHNNNDYEKKVSLINKLQSMRCIIKEWH